MLEKVNGVIGQATNGVWARFYGALYLQAVKAWPKVLTGIFVLLCFWVAAIICKMIILRFAKRVKHRKLIYQMLGRLSKITIIIIGLITALGTMGIDVTALVTGLGLTGFAVGLALKDPISNAISGFLVLFYEPFVIGDRINVDGNDGVVQDIQLRYTILETGEQHVLVPNSTLLSKSITVDDKGKPLPIITIHDCFACHAWYAEDLQRTLLRGLRTMYEHYEPFNHFLNMVESAGPVPMPQVDDSDYSWEAWAKNAFS